MTKPHTRNWVIIAVAVAPLAVIPASIAAGLVSQLFSNPVRDGYFEVGVLFALPISYVFTLFIGLPGFLLLRRYRMHTLPMIICLAMAPVAALWLLVVGWVYFAIPGGWHHSATSVEEFTRGFLFYFYFALWVAIAAWAIAVWIPEKRSNHPLNSDAQETGAR